MLVVNFQQEWVDLLIQSMGFNPEMFGKRNKMLQLLRLVPYVERNYNLIELGPKEQVNLISSQNLVPMEC